MLIDTGSNKNYIQPNLGLNAIPNNKPYIDDTPGGDVKISHYKGAPFRFRNKILFITITEDF